MSLAEFRGSPSLLGWVDQSIAEGLAEVEEVGAPVLHVSQRTFERALPLWIFDSAVKEAHLFGDGERTVLGVGVAASLRGHSPEAGELDPGAFVMGGWGFPGAKGRKDRGPWRAFPSHRWVIPAVTLAYAQGGARISMAVRLSPSSNAVRVGATYRSLVSALERQVKLPRSLPRLKAERDIPPKLPWLSLAKKAIDSLSAGELRKVVLARAVSLSFGGRVPVSLVLDRLLSQNQDSTVFAVKRNGSVFLGATPEGLVSVKKGSLEVDCLAASSPRGRDKATDDELGARLLRDPKSGREHQLVVQAAVSALSPISSMVEFPASPVLKKLATIQHLFTPVRAELLDGEDAWTAARRLWPTPATGGEPKRKALLWTREFERLDRGWYSGVVGVFNGRLDEGKLVVGIRSGLIRGSRALVFAGAGLVEGSKPLDEFEETGWKLRTMKRALGLETDGGG